ncbi:MAG: hypothetical protein JO254_10330 [Pseudolabrys sp.]|nr:hypothetical protein [Pseudolabrys sp.]
MRIRARDCRIKTYLVSSSKTTIQRGKFMAGLYPNDAHWLDTAGRLLVVLGFMVAAIRNLSAHQIAEHIRRLGEAGTPLPAAAFWIGTGMEILGCAMLLFNWHPACGVMLLLIFTVVATLLLLRWWQSTDPMKRGGQQVAFNANIVVCGALCLLLARLPW